MCDEESVGIGEAVPDDYVLYRACTKKNFLTRAKDSVQPEAFYKNGKNHKDGLSLALTVEAAVGRLTTFGVIRITAGDVRSINRGMDVRFDANASTHVIIRNMPCMDRELAERQTAESVATELAHKSTIESTQANIPKNTPSSSTHS
jgi:hypothetical protein